MVLMYQVVLSAVTMMEVSARLASAGRPLRQRPCVSVAMAPGDGPESARPCPRAPAAMKWEEEGSAAFAGVRPPDSLHFLASVAIASRGGPSPEAVHPTPLRISAPATIASGDGPAQSKSNGTTAPLVLN